MENRFKIFFSLKGIKFAYCSRYINRRCKIGGPRMKRRRTRGFLAQISLFFRSGKEKSSRDLQPFLELVSREPMNANAHLRMAEIYDKQGEKKKARSEYLRAAEIFCDSEQYNKGAAIYSKMLQEEPSLEFVNLRLADIYKKMGLEGQAFNSYQKLYCSYHSAGMKDKASELIGFMADLDPEKFTLAETKDMRPRGFEKEKAQGGYENVGEKNSARPVEEGKESFFDLTSMLEANNPAERGGASNLIVKEEGYGFEDIFGELKKTGEVENSYRDYHYQMGLVCKEMGFIDEAVKQFQTALEKEERSVEAAKLLDQCLAFQKPLPQL